MAIITALSLGITNWAFSKYGGNINYNTFIFVILGVLELITWLIIMGVVK